MLSSDRINGPKRFGKALNSIFFKLPLQNMRGLDDATILIPSSSTVSARNAWYNDPPPPPPLCHKYKKNTLQIMSPAAYASETN